MRALEASLARLAAPVEVFFRNDDAGWAQDRLAAAVARWIGRHPEWFAAWGRAQPSIL